MVGSNAFQNKKEMLELKNATISSGASPLCNSLSFRADDGALTCLCHPPGLFLTPLLRAILGLQALSSGYISIDGELLTPASAPEFRKFMAYVPLLPVSSEGILLDMFTTLCSFKVNRQAVSSNEKPLRQVIEAELVKLELRTSLLDEPVTSISSEELRLSMLSVCGLLNKPIVIADEPTSGLGDSSSLIAANYLKSLCLKGTAVLVASSDDRLMDVSDSLVSVSGQ